MESTRERIDVLNDLIECLEELEQFEEYKEKARYHRALLDGKVDYPF